MLPTAQSHIAEEPERSRWDKARLNLLVPIGAIVAVAIVCVVIAVLTSAKRAIEVSLNREQQLLQSTIADKAAHVLRQLDSAAATPQATLHLRNNGDLQWSDRRIGKWLQTFYHQDVVVIFDGRDQIEYSLLRAPTDAAAAGSLDLRAQFATSLDLLRGRLSAFPAGVLSVIATDPAKPGRSAVLIQRFMDRPAIATAWPNRRRLRQRPRFRR